MREAGADLLITTGGLSVDPDDVTRQALVEAGLTDVLHGVPVLPGTMVKDGHAQFFGAGPADGPFPEHYEPAETPLASHPFSKQLSSPVYKFHTSDMPVPFALGAVKCMCV